MSNSTYIGYTFKVSPIQPGTEILIAELGYAGFESFVETDDGVIAYIQKPEWSETILDDIQVLNSDEFEISYSFEEIAQTNWNDQWEKNFKSIVVDDLVTVRAPFHNKPTTKYDIIIEPKMSFGTGHHETTHMMIQHILKNDFKDKLVLDMGCGTGVLAILSEKVGAKSVDAVDIDNWCYQNSLENVDRNTCKRIKVYEGDVSVIKGKTYDRILANINRNSLIQDLPIYANSLLPYGELYLSGFYEEDKPLLNAHAQKYMLKLVDTSRKGDWMSLKFIN